MDLNHTSTYTGLLEKQFACHKAVNSYSAQMGITERRLQRATAAAVGKTWKQMVEERIVLEAKRLLAHSNQSVKEIGFSLGFNEPTNFVHFFHRVDGQTPMAFKQHYAKEQFRILIIVIPVFIFSFLWFVQNFASSKRHEQR